MTIPATAPMIETRVFQSGALTNPDELQMMCILSKVVHDMYEIDAMELMHDKLKATKTNADFFDSMKR